MTAGRPLGGAPDACGREQRIPHSTADPLDRLGRNGRARDRIAH
jgi:hypothetical protein